jgi:peptidoglycan hydrolase-like protein with peptidoglycan-binding domain
MTTPGPVVVVTLFQPELHKGSQDAGRVLRLQHMLNMGGDQIDENGDFDTRTKTAVEAFQRDENLIVDGKVGQETWTRLLTLWLSGYAPG